jgi:hypothetical protein
MLCCFIGQQRSDNSYLYLGVEFAIEQELKSWDVVINKENLTTHASFLGLKV